MKKEIRNPFEEALKVIMAISAAIIILLGGTVLAAEATPDVKIMTYKTVGDRELNIHIHYPYT